MKYVFIDECHSSLRGKKYSAAIASIWEADKLLPFRDALITNISSKINTENNVIKHFPTIHAMEMAKEYDDEIKLFCFETIANTAKDFGVTFQRLGYFDKAPLVSGFNSLSLAVNQLCSLISSSIDDDIVYVYELNISRHTEISQAFNDWDVQYHRLVLGDSNLSVKNIHRIAGRYYCDKKNYHMAVTDTASYVISSFEKREGGATSSLFREGILSRTETIKDMFTLNEVIQVNNLPYFHPGNGAVRYIYPITPSDNETAVEQFEKFLVELRNYMESNPIY